MSSLATKSKITRARDNPFAVDRVLRVRYRLLQDSWNELLARLEQMSYRGAIVGPQGRGKTTLLEDLAQRLSPNGNGVVWLRLSRHNPSLTGRQWRRFFEGLDTTHIVLVDGAEQLGFWAWHWLRRRTQQCAGLVVTSHNPGLLPTLIDCRTTPALLSDIVSQLVRRPSPPLQHATRLLYDKHHGNLRDALRELYDLYAQGNFH